MRLLHGASALLVLPGALALGACGGGSADPGGADELYVALGDSYTAAPLIAEPIERNGCLQSDINYPHLVADELDLRLVDVSCGGATTGNLTTAQQTPQESLPPQADAVTAGTDIVTMGLGGNDGGFFAGLLGCLQLGPSDPDGAPCRERYLAPAGGTASVDEARDTLRENVAAGIRTVRDRSPDARILIVGYPQFAPTSGPCDQFPLATGDVGFVHRLNLALNEALSAAAEAEDVTYVDLYAATEGHDICADDPWIAGGTPTESASPYHPYAKEQEVAAEAVAAAIRG